MQALGAKDRFMTILERNLRQKVASNATTMAWLAYTREWHVDCADPSNEDAEL